MAAWRAATHRRPSIEWAMIDRVNDTEEQATLLAPIARRLGAHVNLIPLNPTPGYPVVGSSKGRIRRFVDALERARVNVTVRDTRGRTIDAACGQLALNAASASPALELRQAGLHDLRHQPRRAGAPRSAKRIVPLPVTRSPSSSACCSITAVLIGNRL